MARLQGKAAFVTGGARGIGRAIALGLVAEGARVAVGDIDLEAARAVASEAGLQAFSIDVGNAASVQAAVEAVSTQLDGIDILVNNAGTPGGAGPLHELPVEALDTALRVNVRGTFLVTQSVAREMIAHGRGGAIVNISSVGAFQPTPGLGHYEATKAAVNALTRSAALELAPHGVRVNAVAPGPVSTPMTRGLEADPGALAAWVRRIPLGRIASTSDIVPAVVFLASEEAAHLTGAVVPIDGGQLLT